MKIEYRVRPVTRYIVTRYEEDGGVACPVTQHGEYDNANIGYEVGYALAKAEHDRLGWEVGDERMKYPIKPDTGVMLGSGGYSLNNESASAKGVTTASILAKQA